MKRIALYIPNLRRGGAERAVSKFSEILKSDYEVDIILHESAIEYPVYGNVVDMALPAKKGLFGKLSVNFKRIRRLKKLKKQNKYECVISFLNNANIVNILSRTKGTRVAVSIRNYYDSDIYSRMTRMTTGLVNFLYRFADCVVPVTKHLEEMLCKKGVSKEKVITLYNPFDGDAIRQKMQDDVLTEEEKSFAEGRFLFTYVGRLSHQKGVWNLLKAFRRLSDRPKVGLFIVGDGEQREKIEEYLKKYQMTNVMAVGQKENPFAYVHRSGIFILPSLAEGFPNVVGEALACGAAVVATDCKTGPREILAPSVPLEQQLEEIYEGEFGLLIAPMSGAEEWDELTDDDERMYRAICRFIDEPMLVSDYRSRAISRADCFGYESARQTIKQIIEGK